jgi:hypothetical protein
MRSGEIPVFALAVAVDLASLAVIPSGARNLLLESPQLQK